MKKQIVTLVLLFLLAIQMFVLLVPMSKAAVEGIENGSFELDDGWTGWEHEDAGIDSEKAHTGTNSCEFTYDAFGWISQGSLGDIPTKRVDSFGFYCISNDFYYKGEVTFTITYSDSSNTSGTHSPSEDGWEYVNLMTYLPRNKEISSILLESTNDDLLWIDDVALSDGEYTEYSSSEKVQNGGFETGDFTGWSTDDSPVEVVTESPHSGTYCAELSTYGYLGSSSLAMYVCKIDSIGFYAKGTFAPYDAGLRIVYNESIGGENWDWLDFAPFGIGTSWTYVNLMSFLRECGTLMQIQFWAYVLFYLDDVSARQVTPVETEPPQYADSSITSSSTRAGSTSVFSCNWTDNSGLYGYVFACNFTGNWANDTLVGWDGSPLNAWSNCSKALPTEIGTTYGYRFYARDMSGNWNVTNIHTITITPESPPYFENIGHSGGYESWQIRFWCTAKSDATEITGYIFGWNASGSWYNYSYRSLSPATVQYIDTFVLGDQYLPANFTCVQYAFWVRDIANIWGFSEYQNFTNYPQEQILSGNNIKLNYQWQRNSFSKYNAYYQFFYNSTDKKVYYAVKAPNSTWTTVPAAATTALWYWEYDWSIWFDGGFVYIAWVGAGSVFYMKKGYIDGVTNRIVWHYGTETIATIGGRTLIDVCTKGAYYFVSVGFTEVVFFWKKSTDSVWTNQTISGAGSHAEMTPYKDGILAFAVPDAGYESGVYYWDVGHNNFTYMFTPNHLPCSYIDVTAHSITAKKDGTKGYLLVSCDWSFAYGYEVLLFSFEIGLSEYNVTVLAGSGGGVQVFIVNDRVIPMWYGGAGAYPPYVACLAFKNYDLNVSSSSQCIYVVRDASMYGYQFSIGRTDNKYMLTWKSSGSDILEFQEVEWSGADYTLSLSADLDCGGWIIADERYYSFTLTVQGSTGADVFDIVNASIQFNFSTYAGMLQCTFWYINGNWTVEMSPDIDDRNLWPARTRNGLLSYSDDNASAYFVFEVWITAHASDLYLTGFNVTLQVSSNTRTSTGFAGDFARIYSNGGFSLNYWTTGFAGKVEGGDAFELYAHNYSSVYNEMVYHNLQHIKMNPEVDALVGRQSYTISFGIDYCNDDGTWYNEIEVRIAAINITYENILGGGERWICYDVNWYQRESLIRTDTIFMFHHGESAAVGEPFNHRVWFDFWFNRINGSTTIGGRVNAYEFPMKDGAAPYLKWLSTAWGVKDNTAKDSMCMADLLDDNGTIMSVSQIKLMKVWCELYVSAWTTSQTATLLKYEVMDLSFGQTPLTGIQTPSFDETRVPTMQQGGLAGFLGSTFLYVGKWLSDNIIFGGLGLWPMFVAFLDTISAWMGYPNGFSNMITWLVGAWGWFATSIVWIAALFPPIFGLLSAVFSKFVTLLVDAATYWIQMITYATSFLNGAYTSGINVWTDFNMSQWIILIVILYPMYLIFVWDEEGLDAVLAQLTFLFGIMSMLASFFLTVIKTIIGVISWIIESIPVVE